MRSNPSERSVPNIEETMKLSIEAELVYNFAQETQVIANLEASRTSDQIILSETLDIHPLTQILSDTTPTATDGCGLRSRVMLPSGTAR